MNCKRCNRPIDDHQAGPETDACVAVVVMEWRQLEDGGPLVHPNTNLIYGYDKKDDIAEYVPHYSTSITDAWKVIEKMSGLQLPNHVGPTMLHRLRECSGKGWGVIFCSDFGYKGEFFAPTPELAICRASLEALSR